MGFNILLVDDSATTRAVMRKTFAVSNLPIGELYEASNGQEALSILEKHWIDVVFTDINMPVMDGVELIDQMSADGILFSIPVVLVTMEGNPRRIEGLKTKGVSAVIRKPFTPEILRDTIMKVLRPQMKSCNKEKVTEVLGGVLEKYAFMFCGEIQKEELPPSMGRGLKSAVYFTGQLCGCLAITIPANAAAVLAANVLGVDPGDETAVEKAEDALRELANVTCGQLLTATAGEGLVFDYSLPELARLDETKCTAVFNGEQALLYMVDDFVLAVEFSVGGAGS